VAADAKSGDGAGVLTQIPRELVAAWVAELGADDVDADDLGVAFLFLRPGEDDEARADRDRARSERRGGLRRRGGPLPRMARGPDGAGRDRRDRAVVAAGAAAGVLRPTDQPRGRPARRHGAERLAYRLRRRARKACDADGVRFYAASWSFVTVTYKAMADAGQLDAFYPDLRDERFSSSLAVFHSRFSTNTAPTWERAQPFRMLCHNGEINTIAGNVNLMSAREGQLVDGRWRSTAPTGSIPG
jgi:glutamate synthase (ferredoxin)